jgi:hypothetical protein
MKETVRFPDRGEAGDMTVELGDEQRLALGLALEVVQPEALRGNPGEGVAAGVEEDVG